MPRMVKCAKLSRELEGLEEPPFGGDLGQKIYDNVSKEAWKMFLEHFKMIINEYRMQDLSSPEAMKAYTDTAEQFLFGEGAGLPPDYVPPPTKG